MQDWKKLGAEASSKSNWKERRKARLQVTKDEERKVALKREEC